MASGFFLPGYTGTMGSFAPGRGIQPNLLTYEDQDAITGTAQTLLRIMSHGGWSSIIGLDKSKLSKLYQKYQKIGIINIFCITLLADKDIINSITVWNGVVVHPSEKAYERSATEPGSMEEGNENDEFGDSEEFVEDENENIGGEEVGNGEVINA